MTETAVIIFRRRNSALFLRVERMTARKISAEPKRDMICETEVVKYKTVAEAKSHIIPKITVNKVLFEAFFNLLSAQVKKQSGIAKRQAAW